MRSSSQIITVDIEEAIYAVKLLKKVSIHTDNFMVNQSRLVALEWMKDLGITRVQIK